MTRLAVSAVGLAVLGLSASVAFAAPAAKPASPASAGARQSVMICETDAATRRAYQREHGVQPVFVTAHEAIRARRDGETWDAPRCMTEREYARLVATTQTRAGL